MVLRTACLINNNLSLPGTLIQALLKSQGAHQEGFLMKQTQKPDFRRSNSQIGPKEGGGTITTDMNTKYLMEVSGHTLFSITEVILLPDL